MSIPKELKERKKKKGRRIESELYEPVKRWLELQGYKTLITAGKRQIFVTTGSFLGVGLLEPDVVGYKKEDYSECLAVVEVKADPMYLFDGIGRCRVFQTVADYVYLALPQQFVDKIGSSSLYEKELKIGILSVGKDEIKEHSKADKVYSHRHELRTVLMSMVKAALNIR